MRSRGRTCLTLRPGDPGTKRFVEKYGDKLVAVRYRYDEEVWRRYTTVELVVDERRWTPERHFSDPDRVVGLRIGFAEERLRQRDPAGKLWWLPCTS
jgi:hypothetical protein